MPIRRFATRLPRQDDVPVLSSAALKRFLDKILIGSDCWLWTGAKNSWGYGNVTVSKRQWGAHRLSYRNLVGPIPHGMELDHLCRQPSCVRPDHLEVVERATNNIRSNSISAINGRAQVCKAGHPFDEHNTYRRPDRQGRDCRACRRRRKKEQRARRTLVGEI
jgi:hypothetical protein